MFRITSLAIAAGLLAAGCAEQQYVYQPEVNAKAQVKGFPAAYYNIPTNQPRGDVRLASFGVVEVQSRQGGGTMRTIEVRMIAANNNDSMPWTIDTRNIVISVPGVGESHPLFVNTSAGRPPVVTIPQGQRHAIDLYYPLPPNVSGEGKLPAFDVIWKVNTSSGLVVERTPFAREEIEPAYAGYYNNWYPDEFTVGLGYGPYWWNDPFYPGFGIYSGPSFRGPLFVHRFPHGGVYGYHGRPFAGHFGGGHGVGGFHGGGHMGGGGHGGGGHR